jgi:RNA polymerase sigma-70 factor (ECF subfamily)
MEENSLSDKDLLKRCIEGNSEARAVFVEKYSRLIYSCIHETLRMNCSDFLREDIEDIFNDIFLSLFKDDCKKLRQFRGDNNCTVASWLRIIAINTTRNFITRNRTFISLENDSDQGLAQIDKRPNPGPSALDQLIDSEEIVLFKQLINELKHDDRLLLTYYYKGDIPPEEIAKIMNITVNTVYSKISRTKKRLKEILESKKLLS